MVVKVQRRPSRLGESCFTDVALRRVFEKYRLDIVGLTLTHSARSGTIPVERSWTFCYARVALGTRKRMGVDRSALPSSLPVHWSSGGMRI